DFASIFGPSLQVHRTITSSVHESLARLTITDDVMNTGTTPAPVAMLYHLNLGAPLVLPGTTIAVAGAGSVARETIPEVPTASVMPEPCTEVTEAVFEHVRPDRDDAERAHLVVCNEEVGIRLDVAWSADTLPRLYQWVLPTRGRWALGIEPATAPLFDRPTGDMTVPTLHAGESRRHEILITIGDL